MPQQPRKLRTVAAKFIWDASLLQQRLIEFFNRRLNDSHLAVHPILPIGFDIAIHQNNLTQFRTDINALDLVKIRASEGLEIKIDIRDICIEFSVHFLLNEICDLGQLQCFAKIGIALIQVVRHLRDESLLHIAIVIRVVEIPEYHIRHVARTDPDAVAIDIIRPTHGNKFNRNVKLLFEISHERILASLNGLELISNLRSEQKIREVVVVSGYDRFDFVQQSLRLGVFDYLLKPIDREELAALMQRLSDHLSIMPETDIETIVINDTPVKHDAVDQILKYINQHYADTLTLRMLSREFYLTETYICDLLKKYTGKTFVAILQEIRLNQAKRLLSETSITIAEVGRQVGYTDQGYFSRIFRRMECMSPMQYRIKTRQER